MKKKWIELLADTKHGAKGHKFELNEDEANNLIDLNVAKACEAPEADASAEAKAVAESLKSIIKTEVETLRKELKEETKNGFKGFTQSFGNLAPAQAKDHALEGRFGFESDGHYFDAVKNAAFGVYDERLNKAKAQT